MDGRGTIIWNDGRKYEGNWKKGQMDGFGKMNYNDGRCYEGNFENGK
jgi:hypothetical protein